MDAKLKLAMWTCGVLSYTQRDLCAQLGYDILALTETHDSGQLRPSKRFLTGDIAPAEDKYAAIRSLLYGCRGPRIAFARIRASSCNLFVVCVYVPYRGRQRPSAADCVIVLGDFNAKLPRSNGQQTGRWCIHRRGNQTGDMLGSLMERKQLCAVSTLQQPRRHATNVMYLSKDRRYGPSQNDYILASRRWSTSRVESKWSAVAQW